ncbi:UPF0280 family protein [Pukyongiella litopenaei]|uniref:UPF0280 family protein n=1 Tax=Pukyongiella litopenaei TaxID=2605946 RepID=A0A2S0MNW5_9RHOB|nr:UPF0280 family protein [Pukyongiella litopenaei]AVO37579.1 UPF0280 family protein [Pukyongiella litopenaei]
MPGAQAAMLPDGRRMHLHHGPIDLVLDAAGPGRDAALRAARARFDSLLQELVDELPDLRRAVSCHPVLKGPVARAMLAAAAPFAPGFITPMAAVAGAVADEILAAMTGAGALTRAYVNNGGDVAVHLTGGETMTAALGSGVAGRVRMGAQCPSRGIATSGWRGRSQSLGIADSVTVLAATAAQADAAATMIANAVDLPDHPAIHRRPANSLFPDSDLGDRPVTVSVGALTPADVARALDSGQAGAETCHARGLIDAALITLSGAIRTVGALPLAEPPTQEPIHA